VQLAHTSAEQAVQELNQDQQPICQQIAKLLNIPTSSLAPYTADWLPWYTVTPHTATLFFDEQPPSSDLDGDQLLIKSIDALNAALFKGIINHKRIGINNIGLILGASPDWLAGATTTGDHIGGSPGGPPTAAPTTPGGPSGTNDSTTPIYVLDTAYAGQTSSPQLAQTGGTLALVPQPNVLPMDQQVPPGLPDLWNNELFQVSNLRVFADQPSPGGQSIPYEEIKGIPQDSLPLDVQDHGLFVSGIIHELAPKAPIRLIRVLNDYGVGDLKTLLFALQNIVCSPANLRVPPPQGGDTPDFCGTSQLVKGTGIINLSLTFEPPLDCLGLIWDQQVSYEADASDPCGRGEKFKFTGSYIPFSASYQSFLYMSALLPFEDLQNGFTIVAAAGNDSLPLTGSGHPPADADMPAAFCNVVAVAASTQSTPQPLSNPSDLARFSNRPYVLNQGQPSCLGFSDDLTQVNLIKRSDLWSQKALGKGVCSIYLDMVVDPTTGRPTIPNSHKDALWDGTSFATAIVSANVLPLTITQFTPGTCGSSG
jgi:hypothetical protein